MTDSGMTALRERLIRKLYWATWDAEFHPFGEAPRIEVEFTGHQVDAILAELAAAGYVLVERERLERLQTDARRWADAILPVDWSVTTRPGDLDPLPEVKE